MEAPRLRTPRVKIKPPFQGNYRMPRELAVVILAAGQGKRMLSDLPKVLHPVGGRPMLGWSLALARSAGAARTIVVVSPQGGAIGEYAGSEGAETVVQDTPLGTGHAVRAAENALGDFDGDVLVLFADTPLVRPDTVREVLAARMDGAGLVVLGFEAREPGSYGRLITDEEGALVAIVEAKDASAEQRAVRLCNAGALCADRHRLFGWLQEITPANASGEYYLTDCAGLARRDGIDARVVLGTEEEFAGANDRVQLAEVEATFQQWRRRDAMLAGVTLIAPETVFFSYDTALARDVRIEPHVVFGPGVEIEAGVVIKSFSHLEGAQVRAGAEIGPFARLRPGTEIGREAKVGNFVETKKARLADGVKVGHLTYLGDADIGARTNIGAGTITCNYDGARKHQTTIGEDCFIGSDTALVAPVTLGDRVYTGSGSVITKDVPDDTLAVARGRQRNIEGWTRPTKT